MITIQLPHDTTVGKASQCGALAQAEFGDSWEIVGGEYTSLSGQTDDAKSYQFLTRIVQILDS